MQKTLAILSRKGRTGKTPLATHLSVAAERTGYTTALIDINLQSSAAKWRDNRDSDTLTVISTHVVGVASPETVFCSFFT